MKITIVPPDKVVKVEGVRKKLLDFDWSPFDEIHAVQADIGNNRAEVEFRAIDPDGPGPLPSVKPPNEIIDAVDFQDRFGAIIAAFDAAPAPVRRAQTDRPAVPSAPVHDPLGARVAALETKLEILIEEISRVKGAP